MAAHKPKQTERKRSNTAGSFCKLRARSRSGSIPYVATERILVVGDGNFSFSLALAEHLNALSADSDGHANDAKSKRRKHKAHISLVATSYDKPGVLRKKYGGQQVMSKRLSEIRRLGARIMHGVDATQLDAFFSHKASFDAIVFNFPHMGGKDGLAASIAQNKELMRNFFRSAVEFLRPGGEIHVTLMDRYPYTSWNIAGQARAGAGDNLTYCGEVPFIQSLYPDYNHVATTKADRMHGVGAEITVSHVWRLNTPPATNATPPAAAASSSTTPAM